MPRREPLSDLDKNKDGKIDAADGSASGEGDEFSSELGALFGDLPNASSGRGAPLWPYELPSDSDGTELTVENRAGTRVMPGQSQRTGPRYFEADTLAPLRWSPEQRAQLQQSLWKMGLYGKTKVRLGSWSSADQAVFAQLLGSANVDGREWFEQLAYWRKFPPTDLLDQVNGEGGTKPTIRVTNPIDIRTTAEQVSQGLTGRVDRGFVNASAASYQSQEIAAQQGAISDQEAGGGGTVTDAPAADAFLADKLRQEQPLEVDGYAFVGAFDTFLDMIGAR